MKLIQRDYYLKKMIDVIATPDIKVITGVRRCGKSKLLDAFIDYLSNTDDNNIIHINLSLSENEYLLEYHALEQYIESRYLPSKNNFVLIDEVQICNGFEKAINSLHTKEKYSLYITGSNAFLLSSDIATLFTGRTFEIKVYPFSFVEYKTYRNENMNYPSFDSYIKDGGMSGSYLYKNQEDRLEYLKGIYDTLIIRDIVTKYKIKNTILLNRTTDFLMSNISNITSNRNIAEELSKSGETINHKTVGKYLQYLCNAFLFYPIPRYDIVGKKYLTSSYKYYLVDPSFRYAEIGTKNADTGRILENIVAIELLRRGYEVYVGMLYKTEIDFVAIKRGEKTYIQVSDDITNEKTFNREVSSLLKIKDAYPKILIARTRSETYQHEGIKIIDIADWLNETK